jgi:hypothetical protein
MHQGECPGTAETFGIGNINSPAKEKASSFIRKLMSESVMIALLGLLLLLISPLLLLVGLLARSAGRGSQSTGLVAAHTPQLLLGVQYACIMLYSRACRQLYGALPGR